MSRTFSDALVERVKRAKWFAKVGTGQLPDCVRVDNWTAAVSELGKAPFKDAATETINTLRGGALEECKAHGSEWIVEWRKFSKTYDAALGRSRALAEELSRTTIGQAPIDKKLIAVIVPHFRNRLMMALTFAELFGDDVEHFDRTFMELFVEGFFPCGYRGEYPNGKIVVY
jgi:hypothetical protein